MQTNFKDYFFLNYSFNDNFDHALLSKETVPQSYERFFLSQLMLAISKASSNQERLHSAFLTFSFSYRLTFNFLVIFSNPENMKILSQLPIDPCQTRFWIKRHQIDINKCEDIIIRCKTESFFPFLVHWFTFWNSFIREKGQKFNLNLMNSLKRLW